jgi:hypothetical protein
MQFIFFFNHTKLFHEAFGGNYRNRGILLFQLLFELFELQVGQAHTLKAEDLGVQGAEDVRQALSQPLFVAKHLEFRGLRSGLCFISRVSGKQLSAGCNEKGAGRLVKLAVFTSEPAQVSTVFLDKYEESVKPFVQ